jgi:hypothetical protein
MRPLHKTRRRASAHGRRRDPIAEKIEPVGTMILIILTAIGLVIGAIALVLMAHSRRVTDGVAAGAILVCAGAVVWLGRIAMDSARRSQVAVANLADKIEFGSSGVVALLGGKGSPQSFRDLKEFLRKNERNRLSVFPFKRSADVQAKDLLDDLEKRFTDDERLSVIRLDGRHILEAPQGFPEDGLPESILCLKIVDQLGGGFEETLGLSAQEKEVAADLRDVVSYFLEHSAPLDQLRLFAVDRVKKYEGLTDRLVLLANASPESLQRDAGKWLLDLLVDLSCAFGVLTQESDRSGAVGQVVGRPDALQHAVAAMTPWLPEQQVIELLPALRSVVFVPGGFDLGLLRIRCAVLVEAAKLGKKDEAIERLPAPDGPKPEDLVKAAALEVRWLVESKTGRTDVLDRLAAVVEMVTPQMFAVLLRDLKLNPNGASDIFNWLSSNKFSTAGIIVRDETDDKTVAAIGLNETIGGAILNLLHENENSAIEQQARIAAERCYRECLILDPKHVPGDNYDAWMTEGYGGLTLFESINWRENLRVWSLQVGAIESLEDRWDAKVAITCLFLEAWWWCGDQLRLPFVGEVLDLAKGILEDQPEWISALHEFDTSYVPEFDQPGTSDQWRHVANALSFLAGALKLRQGEIPPDRVLARIYVCWCAFNGDAQHAVDLAAADSWYRQAVEACDGLESGPAMRAFTNYQRADLWIPSDTDRSLRLITETNLAGSAISLDDLSLQAYIARMYGDIRWASGNIDGAFDAYSRALLLTYVYQVDQESPKMPPSDYTCSLYNEQRTRLLARLDEARQKGLKSAADAAAERIRKLFGPYWALGRTAAGGDDRLASIAPPLPAQEDVKFASLYVKDALAVKGKLLEQIAESL